MQPILASIGETSDLDTLRRHLLQRIVQRETLRRVRLPAVAADRAASRERDVRPGLRERVD
jgi:hypothetical protein